MLRFYPLTVREGLWLAPPPLWQSVGINDISGYTHLTNDNQLVNFNNHFIWSSSWNCIT